jgi:hypothetical protein
MSLMFRKKFCAGDGVGIVFFEIDDAVDQIDEKPVKGAHPGKEPWIVSCEKPAKCKDTEGTDGRDMQSANHGEHAQQSFISHLTPIMANH